MSEAGFIISQVAAVILMIVIFAGLIKAIVGLRFERVQYWQLERFQMTSWVILARKRSKNPVSLWSKFVNVCSRKGFILLGPVAHRREALFVMNLVIFFLLPLSFLLSILRIPLEVCCGAAFRRQSGPPGPPSPREPRPASATRAISTSSDTSVTSTSGQISDQTHVPITTKASRSSGQTRTSISADHFSSGSRLPSSQKSEMHSDNRRGPSPALDPRRSSTVSDSRRSSTVLEPPPLSGTRLPESHTSGIRFEKARRSSTYAEPSRSEIAIPAGSHQYESHLDRRSSSLIEPSPPSRSRFPSGFQPYVSNLENAHRSSSPVGIEPSRNLHSKSHHSGLNLESSRKSLTESPSSAILLAEGRPSGLYLESPRNSAMSVPSLSKTGLPELHPVEKRPEVLVTFDPKTSYSESPSTKPKSPEPKLPRPPPPPPFYGPHSIPRIITEKPTAQNSAIDLRVVDSDCLGLQFRNSNSSSSSSDESRDKVGRLTFRTDGKSRRSPTPHSRNRHGVTKFSKEIGTVTSKKKSDCDPKPRGRPTSKYHAHCTSRRRMRSVFEGWNAIVAERENLTANERSKPTRHRAAKCVVCKLAAQQFTKIQMPESAE